VTIAERPDHHARYAIVGAHAGSGCDDFEGLLVELFRIDGPRRVAVADPDVSDPGDGDTPYLPDLLFDIDCDGRPEVAGFSNVLAWDGATYSSSASLTLGFHETC
jgi:hypothetical protein